MKVEIKHRFTDKVILCGEYESIKDCLEKNRGVNLEDANLRGADLRGAKNYSESHPFLQEIIRRQELKTFTDKEWSIIGQILVHTLCWDSIKKRFGTGAMKIFKKLSKVGFEEWEEKYKEVKSI